MSAIDLILAAALTFTCQTPGLKDSDTWTCANGLTVRAFGVDGPEAGTPQSPPAVRAMAHIINGQDLTCEKRGTSWGRVVAYCTTPDGKDIAAALMRTGWAQDCPRYSKGFYAPLRPTSAPALPPRHASCEVR